ncbi:MAG: hypothetical protein Q9Q40_09870, partial [Acidobacteriota bacterium]|nr:hypothetical protein [Acidobacteriota bacterium]
NSDQSSDALQQSFTTLAARFKDLARRNAAGGDGPKWYFPKAAMHAVYIAAFRSIAAPAVAPSAVKVAVKASGKTIEELCREAASGSFGGGAAFGVFLLRQGKNNQQPVTPGQPVVAEGVSGYDEVANHKCLCFSVAPLAGGSGSGHGFGIFDDTFNGEGRTTQHVRGAEAMVLSKPKLQVATQS